MSDCSVLDHHSLLRAFCSSHCIVTLSSCQSLIDTTRCDQERLAKSNIQKVKLLAEEEAGQDKVCHRCYARLTKKEDIMKQAKEVIKLHYNHYQ